MDGSTYVQAMELLALLGPMDIQPILMLHCRMAKGAPVEVGLFGRIQLDAFENRFLDSIS